MAGLDFVILAICIWLIDHQGYQRLTRPFVILGMNAITIYMISELLEELLSNHSSGRRFAALLDLRAPVCAAWRRR